MRRVLAARSLAIGLAAVLALALLVNVVELLCTAGFPAVYAAEVARQAPGPQAARLQFALYLVGYAAPSSALAAAAVALLSSPKLTLGAGRWLKLLSGVAILVLGLPMLIPRG